MTLYDFLMIYNFRDGSKDTSKLDDNTQIIRIYPDDSKLISQDWIEFGVYDFSEDEIKAKTINIFLNSKILKKEVTSFRLNYDVDVVEVYLKEEE